MPLARSTALLLAGVLLVAGCSGGNGDGSADGDTGAGESAAGSGSESAAGSDTPAEESTLDLASIDVAAEFEGGEVTGAELEEAVAAARDQALQGLEGEEREQTELQLARTALGTEIQVELVRRLAQQEYGLEATEEEVDEALAGTVEQAGGQEAFETFLQQNGLTEEAARERIAFEVLLVELQELLAEEQGLDDAAVREEFDTRAAEGQYTESEVRHILVETEEEAQAALERLDGGEDFAEVAMDVSTGPSAPSGGELGSAPRGAYVEPFEEAVWAEDTEIGEVLGPVETEFGWHLIRVDDRVERSFTEVEEELRSEMASQAASTRFDQEVQEAVGNADISVNEEIGTWDDEANQVVPAG